MKQQQQVSLDRVMGVKDYFMLGFGSMVGVGWCVALNSWILAGGSVPVTILTFAIVTAMVIPVGLCYAEMTAAMPVAGGVLAYAYRAFGTKVAFVAGWLALLAYINVMPWEAIYINDVFAYLFPGLCSGLILYEVGGSPVYLNALIIGIALSCLLILVNWKGAKVSSKVQNISCYTMIVGFFVIAGFSLAKFDFDNLTLASSAGIDSSLVPKSLGIGVLSVISLAPFYFSGFDTICQGAEESQSTMDYGKLGLVIVMGMLATGIYYMTMIFSAGIAVPTAEFVDLPRPSICYMFRMLYSGALGNILYFVTLITALAGLFTTWNGFYSAGARLCLGMGRAGLMPAFFAKVHPKNRTPVGGNILFGIACIAGPFIGIGLIDPLTIIGSFAFMLCWFCTVISCWHLRKAAPDMNRPFRAPGKRIVMILGCVTTITFALICVLPVSPGYMGNVALVYFVVWIALGAVLYAAGSRQRNSLSEAERAADLFAGMQQ